jgi:hypothetical protein
MTGWVLYVISLVVVGMVTGCLLRDSAEEGGAAGRARRPGGRN